MNTIHHLEYSLLRSTDSVDALVIVVKEASLIGTDYDEEDDEGNEIDDGLDDPVQANEDCRANDCHHRRIVEVLLGRERENNEGLRQLR